MTDGRRLRIVAVAVGVLLIPAPPASADARLRYTAPAMERGRVVVDQTRHHNDGRLRGGTRRHDGAYRFRPFGLDHRHDRITRRRSASLNPGRGPFTYSVRVRVRPDAVWEDSEMAVLRRGDSNEPGGDYKMELRKNRSGVVVAQCVIRGTGPANGFVRGHVGAPKINDGGWHTIGCSRVGRRKVALTIDGTRTVRAAPGPIGAVNADVPLLIGCQSRGRVPGFREQFVGRMDNIKVEVRRG